MYVPLFALSLADPQGVDIIVRMTKITSHLNDDVVFLQIINSVLMAYPPIGSLWMHSIRLLFVGSQKNRTLMINIFISFSFNFFLGSSVSNFIYLKLASNWIELMERNESQILNLVYSVAYILEPKLVTLFEVDFTASEPCFYLF